VTHESAFENADVVVGLSKPGSFCIADIHKMAKNPIIFTLANPTPEVFPEDIKIVRPDAIIATGRSDFANQVNNVLGFPFIFRGALDSHAKKINIQMKLAAAHALAELAREKVPKYLCEIYNTHLTFSKNYIIPKPFDKRLIVEISYAVAKAAVESGVADTDRFDINGYRDTLLKHL
jgi:malate dehydrogenase (oxaloacetate-decarboxylating)/malate dehydrogenase (oxaloacetate-decarboxylating)(NADP+)